MFSLWVYAGVSSKSWLDSRWDLCPAKPCGGMLILYTSEYHPRLGWIHRGALVGVSSVRWDAHLYYAGFHTSHGCIRSAGTCRVNRTVICCAVFHKSHGWALAVQNVLTKSARRDARILSPQTQQHTVHDTQSRIGHCELFRPNGVHDTQSRIGHCVLFRPNGVHDTQSRIGHCELFRPNGVHDTQSRIGCCEPFRPNGVHDTQSRIGHCELFRPNGVHDTQSRIGRCELFRPNDVHDTQSRIGHCELFRPNVKSVRKAFLQGGMGP